MKCAAALALSAEALLLRPHWVHAKKQRGLTQDVLADTMGVTQGAVHKWLAGKQYIPDRRLIELADLLGFDPVSIRPGIAFLFLHRDISVSEEALVLARAIEALDPASRAVLKKTLSDITGGDA